MKYPKRRVTACVVLGMVTTLVVAVVSVLALSWRMSDGPRGYVVVGGPVTAEQSTGGARLTLQAAEHVSPGIRRVRFRIAPADSAGTLVFDGKLADTFERRIKTLEPESVLSLIASGELPPDPAMLVIEWHQAGWPFLSFTAVSLASESGDTVFRGFAFPKDTPRSALFVVPLWPKWTGLIANVAVWSLVWAGLLLMRDRVKPTRWFKNRCVSCGYSMTGVAGGVCPECGYQVAAFHAALNDELRRAQTTPRLHFVGLGIMWPIIARGVFPIVTAAAVCLGALLVLSVPWSLQINLSGWTHFNVGQGTFRFGHYHTNTPPWAGWYYLYGPGFQQLDRAVPFRWLPSISSDSSRWVVRIPLWLPTIAAIFVSLWARRSLSIHRRWMADRATTGLAPRFDRDV